MRLLDGQTVEEGADLGVPGYNEVIVKDDVIYGSAWVDVTKENMADYDF
jgi:simple sugar transport system substrate-binding protein